MKSFLAAAVVALSLAAGSGGALAQFMDANSIIAGIGDSKFLTAAAHADDASSVRVVRLSTFAGAGQSADRLAGAVSAKSSDLDYLRGHLALNPVAITAIRNSGFSLDDIVSISMSGDTAAILYADDL